MKTVIASFVVLFGLLPLLATGGLEEQVACASKMAALLEVPADAKIGTKAFDEFVRAKVIALGERKNVIGWILDSSEKKKIPFIADCAGGGFIVRISSDDRDHMYSAFVQFIFSENPAACAVYSRLQDQGPR